MVGLRRKTGLSATLTKRGRHDFVADSKVMAPKSFNARVACLFRSRHATHMNRLWRTVVQRA